LIHNHFTFYISYLGMNYSNVIGFCLILIFVIQFSTGFLLSFYYSPFYTMAFSSVSYIMIDINIGWMIRIFHVLGSSLIMLFILVHIIRGTWIKMKVIENGLYTSMNMNYIWVSGFLLFSLMILESFIGYVLVFGNMSYWGIKVIINIVSIVPAIGLLIVDFIYCSSNLILGRVFIIHFFIGLSLTFIIILHILILHAYSSSNPIINSNSSFLITFSIVFIKDIFILLVSSILIILFFIVPELESMIGNCDNLIAANYLITPNHILPEWYFLIWYASLRALPNKIMGVLIVVIFIVLFL